VGSEASRPEDRSAQGRTTASQACLLLMALWTPPAPSDGPPKDEEDSEGGPPSDEAEKPSEDKPGEDGPPKPGEDEGKPNVEHQLVELTGLLHQIADALGVPVRQVRRIRVQVPR
jgi:hypothetical protein